MATKCLAQLCALVLLILAFTVHAQAQAQDKLYQSFLKPQVRQQQVLKETVSKPTMREQQKLWRRNGPLSVLSRGVLWGGAIADDLTTRNVLKRGGREGNPILATDGGYNRPVFYGINAGIDAATTLLERRHPKLAIVLRFAVGGAHIVVAGFNARR